MPFEIKSQQKPFADFLNQAKQHLVQTVDSYKISFGKTAVDQMQLVPDEFKGLVWWLFPSQVLPDLLQTKKSHAFEMLYELSEQSDQNLPFSIVFQPKDYNNM